MEGEKQLTLAPPLPCSFCGEPATKGKVVPMETLGWEKNYPTILACGYWKPLAGITRSLVAPCQRVYENRGISPSSQRCLVCVVNQRQPL